MDCRLSKLFGVHKNFFVQNENNVHIFHAFPHLENNLPSNLNLKKNIQIFDRNFL